MKSYTTYGQPDRTYYLPDHDDLAADLQPHHEPTQEPQEPVYWVWA